MSFYRFLATSLMLLFIGTTSPVIYGSPTGVSVRKSGMSVGLLSLRSAYPFRDMFLQSGHVRPLRAVLKKSLIRKPLYAVGYSIRTNTTKMATDSSEITSLWMRCMQQGFFTEDRHRVGHRLVALYSNYRTDGSFTYTLGILTDSPEDLPPGTSAHLIKSGVYGAFHSDKGSLAKILRPLWEKSLDEVSKDNTVLRSYDTDYELYDEDTVAGSSTEVDLYVGLKPAHK